MRKRLALTLVVLVVSPLSACGGDDDDGGSTAQTGQSNGAVAKANADAKSAARQLQAFVETCYADTQNYRDCDTQNELPEGATQFFTGPTRASIQTFTDDSYFITTRGAPGAEFDISRDPDGTIERTCSPDGAPGCSAGGTW